MNKKQIKAIEELTGFKYSKKYDNFEEYCDDLKVGILYVEIESKWIDYVSFLNDGRDDWRIGRAEELSKRIPIKWLAPLAEILEGDKNGNN